MPARPFAALRGVSKTYRTPSGGIEALHEVDAEFRTGEITAVVGASGSGKSTLLRLLAGLDRTDSGSIRVRSTELAGADATTLRRHRRDAVTFVSQRAAENLIPHLTVREHDRAALTTLREFGLGDRLDSTPGLLSGGEQARAAFALALARRTRLVIADEPTAELDRDSAKPLLLAIREHSGAGVGFVIATHDDDVIAIADRVIRLDRGRVIGGVRTTASPRPVAPPGGDTVVEAVQLHKSYRRGRERIDAVVEVTLELARGEVTALLGRSGSGKSTVLALLAGFVRPDAGEIRYRLSSAQPSRLSWRELAFLPQRFGLLPELSVRENVLLPARLAGVDARSRLDLLLERLGLAEHADRFPPETSIGQQQRTALARALLLEPAVLLADEPTSHQDAGWRDAVWKTIVDAAQGGSACLIATHEEEIARDATTTCFIDSGVALAAEARRVGTSGGLPPY